MTSEQGTPAEPPVTEPAEPPVIEPAELPVTEPAELPVIELVEIQGPGSRQARPPADNAQPPVLNVTKGQPTAEELAAVTAVVLALQGGAEQEPAKPATRTWARRTQLNLAPKPGPGAWRRSVR